MREFYYYERDSENRPMRTFCLIQVGEKISKGVAICSPKDQPQKKVGRMLAQAKAFESILSNSKRFSNGGNYLLSDINPALTGFEKKLLQI